MSRLMVVRRLLLIAGLLSISVTGCSSDDAGAAAVPSMGADSRGKAAVRPGNGFAMQALAVGILRADAATGCLWLQGESGQPTAQVLLQGDSYSVDFSTSPATVRKDGEAVARVDDRVDLGGGYRAVQGVQGCPVTAATFLGYFE